MATTVVYNSVTFYNVVTRRWSHEMIYDASGTDLVGERLTLAFDGVIHAQRVPITDSVTYVAAGSSPPTAAAAYRQVEDLLKIPRQRLQVFFGEHQVIDVRAASSGQTSLGGLAGGTDIDNGPKPRRVELFHIVGNSAFRVRFEIEIMVGDCKTIGPDKLVVNNKWRVTEDLDSNFFCTRRIEGRLRLAVARSSTAGVPAGHQFKPLVMPVLEDGFRRESIAFTAEENGLDCSYSVVDKQVHTAAPWPATDMEVIHEESTNDGTHYISGVSIRLKGAPHTDKRLLIERAVQIVEQRLDFLSKSPSEPEQVITRASIKDYIGAENVIELDLQVMQVPKDNAFLTRLRKEKLGVPLELPPVSVTNEQDGTSTVSEIPGSEYDPRISALPQVYGYDPHGGERRPGVLMLLHTFLQDPCQSNASRAVYAGQSSETSEPGDRLRSTTPIAEMPPGSLDTDPDEDRYSDETRTAIYTMSKITSEYTTHRMKVQMPIAQQVPSRSPTAPTCVTFDLAEPQAMRVVEIDVERIGDLPKLPEPLEEIRDGTLVQTLKRKDEKIYPPVLTADGRHEVFRVQARYEYILNRPPLPAELLRIGTHPHTQGLTNALSQNQLYESQLV